MSYDAEFLAQLESNSIWILSETQYRQHYLSANLTSSSLQNTLEVCCETIGDALALWCKKCLEIAELGALSESIEVSFPTHLEQCAILEKLILESKKQLPTLCRKLERDSKGGDFLSADISHLKLSLDSIRLHQTDQKIIGQIIDEFGNADQHNLRAEELIILLDLFANYQAQNLLLDAVSVREILLGRLSAVARDRLQELKILPEAIVLDFPSYVYPLEQNLWLRIAQVTNLSMSLQESVFEQSARSLRSTISWRWLAPLKKFLEETPQIKVFTFKTALSSRQKVIEQIFDNPQMQSDALEQELKGVRIWSCNSRRDEVRYLAAAIGQALKNKQLNPADILIVCCNLDAYYQVLSDEFAKAGIEFFIAKGKALSQTGPGKLFLAFLSWITTPKLKTVREYFENPLVANTKIVKKDIDNFLKVYRQRFNQLLNSAGLRGVEVDELCEKIYLDETSSNLFALEQLMNSLGISEEFGNSKHFAEPILEHFIRLFSGVGVGNHSYGRLGSYRQKEQALHQLQQVLQALVFIHSKLVFVENLQKLDLFKCLKLIRREFFAAKLNTGYFVNEIKTNSAADVREGYRRELLLGYRQLNKALLATERLAVQRTALGLKQAPKKRRVFAVQRLLTESLSTRVQYQQESQSAICVSELLDTRAISSKYLAVLGLSSLDFGHNFENNPDFDSIYGTLRSALALKSGAIEPIYELYWLVQNMFCNVEEILFSTPKEINSSKVLPVAWLDDLASLSSSIPIDYLNIKLDNIPRPAVDRFYYERTLKLLNARQGEIFSEYDGYLGEQTLELLKNIRPQCFLSDNTICYSVSELELLARSALMYFFNVVLGISEPSASFAEEVRLHTGIIVHKALEQFFQNSDAAALVGNNFEQACEEMRRIANNLFERSQLVWENHSALRAAKAKSIRGLDNIDPRIGYLKAALSYQRDLLQTKPAFSEYRFGHGKGSAAALEINSEQGLIKVSGTIDRIDSSEEPDAISSVDSIWDYKTGKSARMADIDSGLSLQLPLYAAVVVQNFGASAIAKRGGCISLAEPNRRDPDLASLSKGVLIEHLAVAKQGRRFVLDSSAVQERIDFAIEQVKLLDERVRNGEFFQNEDSEHFAYGELGRLATIYSPEIKRKFQMQAPKKSHTAHSSTPERLISQSGQQLFLLSEEQRQASAVDKNIVLVAGAGSGKTAVLRSRVIKLLLQGESIESILAITFTEKAAAEIKARVEQAISIALKQNQFEGDQLTQLQRGYLIEARAKIAQAQFSTIHAFAARIVQMEPELSNVSQSWRIVTGGEHRELLVTAIERILGGQLKNQRQRVDRVLDQGVSYYMLQAQVRRLLGNRRLLFQLEQSLCVDSSKLQILEQELFSYINQIVEKRRKVAVDFLISWRREAADWLTDAVDKLNLSEQAQSDFSHLFFEVADIVELLRETNCEADDLLSRCDKLLKFLQEQSKSAKRKSAKNPRNYWKELKDWLQNENLSALAIDREHESKGLLLARDITFLALECFKSFQELKHVREVFDFDDLIFNARSMLCTSFSDWRQTIQEGLLTRLRKRFKHFMVDEFQDTDPYQWEMLRAIAVADTEQGQDNTIFIVGDGKQGIYSFRGGDIRVFNEVERELVEAGATNRCLQDNYRSASAVVEFLNLLFEKLFLADFDDKGCARSATATKHQPMRAKRGIDDKLERVAVLWQQKDDPLLEEFSGDHLEAQKVAELAKQVLEDRQEGFKKWAALSDYSSGAVVGILTRTLNQLKEIAFALESEGVAFSISHNGGFFDLEEIVQFEYLFRALNCADDHPALIGLLRSALLGCSDKELLELCAAANGDWCAFYQKGLLESELAVQVQQTIQSWQRLAAILGPAQLLSTIIAERELLVAYQAADLPEKSQNIERFVEALSVAQQSGQIAGSISSVLDWISQQRHDTKAQTGAETNTEAIVLSTIHGAKGLEYPMVILPFLSARTQKDYDFLTGDFLSSQQKQKSVLGLRVEHSYWDYKRVQTILSSSLEQQNWANRCSEERRIFYVACSRAKEYLVLSMREGSDFAKRQTQLQKLSAFERAEAIFHAEKPEVWLKHLMQIDNVNAPTSWSIGEAEKELIIPLLQ